ncbi:MAG TPA: glutathione S-transferase family protein [Thermoplasmata archaeon]|nr:glutathione S-transferase family protein [Thermoplasmata archaeon]
MTARVRLFYHPISHYCVSAERMLRFKGIRAEVVYTPYHDHQALIRASGQDYIPTLDWSGRFVTWSEIPAFLDRVQPTPQLVPPGKAGLARTLESWGHLVLEERVWRAVVTQVPPTLRDDEERWVFEELQTRARGPWAVLAHRRKEFVADLSGYFGLVDAMLKGREWVLDEPTVADFGIYGSLSPWTTVGERLPSKYPHLVRWAQRIRDL